MAPSGADADTRRLSESPSPATTADLDSDGG